MDEADGKRSTRYICIASTRVQRAKEQKGAAGVTAWVMSKGREQGAPGAGSRLGIFDLIRFVCCSMAKDLGLKRYHNCGVWKRMGDSGAINNAPLGFWKATDTILPPAAGGAEKHLSHRVAL